MSQIEKYNKRISEAERNEEKDAKNVKKNSTRDNEKLHIDVE